MINKVEPALAPYWQTPFLLLLIFYLDTFCVSTVKNTPVEIP